MSQRFICASLVKIECQSSEITYFVCGLALFILALVLGARGLYTACGVAAVFSGGFFGGALAALRLERRFKD